jgi:mannitol-1-phosphate 5-dehydrogenase
MTGFGFGPIQSGIFAYEAFRSGNFERIVISEVDETLVEAVTRNGGAFEINVAGPNGIERVRVAGVEMLHPERDRAKLVEALRQSTEIVTALPAVAFFTRGEKSVADLIAEGLKGSTAPATIVYTAENNNRAAEILEAAVGERLERRAAGRVQFLNTVIGKMSQVVTEEEKIREKGLAPLAPEFGRAHLVETFNRILVTRCAIDGFRPGIECFVEKGDLLPFEEAKLFGHNAIHALMGFLGARKGYASMADLARDGEIMRVARGAFLEESGAALIRKYAALGDPLFTSDGFKEYAEDLLARITNPWLEDSVGRAVRDPLRKLGPGDRIFGTMALALEQGIEPRNLALGAAAGMQLVLREAEHYQVPGELRDENWNDAGWVGRLLDWMWGGQSCANRDKIVALLQKGVNHE